MENPRNIMRICKDCVDERKSDTQKRISEIMTLKDRLDKGNNIWFKVGLTYEGITEHVWISVNSINLEDRTFIGKIDNDLITVVSDKYSYGDVMVMSFNDIEDTLKG